MAEIETTACNKFLGDRKTLKVSDIKIVCIFDAFKYQSNSIKNISKCNTKRYTNK